LEKNERKKMWKDPNVVNENIIPEEIQQEKNQLKKINLFDLLVYLPSQLLTKIDRTSMMHSLEIRSPFLDTELAEFVYNIPTEYKMDKRGGKIILKDILADSMPREFVYRPKQGFGAPVVEWLKTDKTKKLVYEIFGGTASLYDFLRKEEVIKLIDRFYRYNDDSIHYKIWTLLSLELWFKSHDT